METPVGGYHGAVFPKCERQIHAVINRMVQLDSQAAGRSGEMAHRDRAAYWSGCQKACRLGEVAAGNCPAAAQRPEGVCGLGKYRIGRDKFSA